MSKATESVQKARIANYEEVIGSIQGQLSFENEELERYCPEYKKHLEWELNQYKGELEKIKKLGKC